MGSPLAARRRRGLAGAAVAVAVAAKKAARRREQSGAAARRRPRPSCSFRFRRATSATAAVQFRRARTPSRSTSTATRRRAPSRCAGIRQPNLTAAQYKARETFLLDVQDTQLKLALAVATLRAKRQQATPEDATKLQALERRLTRPPVALDAFPARTTARAPSREASSRRPASSAVYL